MVTFDDETNKEILEVKASIDNGQAAQEDRDMEGTSVAFFTESRPHYWGEIDVYLSSGSDVSRVMLSEVATTRQLSGSALTPEYNQGKSKSSPSAEAVSQLERGSSAVHQHITTVRFRYIVGNLAGEDLYEKNGTKIVSKGEVITEEIVNRADRTGVLPELITRMTLPGMEE